RLIHKSLLSRSSGEPSRTLCKHFTSVSPDMSGHECQTDRAPMLVGTPLPVNLSVFVALGPALWIRRVLVRAGEGNCEAWHRGEPASPLRTPSIAPRCRRQAAPPWPVTLRPVSMPIES